MVECDVEAGPDERHPNVLGRIMMVTHGWSTSLWKKASEREEYAKFVTRDETRRAVSDASTFGKFGDPSVVIAE